MHSLKSASALLDATSSAFASAPLLRELGFAPEPIRLHPEAIKRLGLTDPSRHWHIASGTGGLRALAFDLAGIDEPRMEMTRIASRLASSAPHLFWILVGVSEKSTDLVIAAWNQGQSPPRIAALVAHRGRIVDSDCETVCALSSARSQSDILTHGRWLEILGRQSVTRRFFRALQSSVNQLAQSLDPVPPPNDAFELALLYLSRLLFLSFLETKGWLDRDHAFLGNQYADCMVRGGRFHARVLSPLFFGTLNTHPRNRARRAREFGRIPFLNGGLFARSILERRTAHASFSDEALGDLFANLLGRYRFTAREDTTAWSEAAIDPEMLGKAFESLMGVSDRRRTGAFYTPQSLVERLTSSALANGLSTPHVTREKVAAALRGEIPSTRDRACILLSVDRIRILDPACGSGAFLVHGLETLASLRLRLGDVRPLHVIRRTILTSSIFGVDVNPMAVWLCELRLWLSMAIENPEADPMKVAPLPNLDRHIRVGDSLGGTDFGQRPDIPGAHDLAAARERYSRAVGPRKKNLARILDRSERACAIVVVEARIGQFRASRRELLMSIRSRDLFGERNTPPADARRQLATMRQSLAAARRALAALKRGAALPFSFPTHFADVGAAGGFDVVIGNPPWIRTGNVSRDDRLRLRRAFRVYRESAWQAGADAAAAGTGFASQVDVAALFVERSVRLARDSGTIALLLPAKLWRSLAGGGVRAFLLEETEMLELHDLTESEQAFDAAVYPSLLVAKCARHRAAEQPLMQTPVGRVITNGDFPTVATVDRRRQLTEWRVDREGIRFDASRGSPWILAPPEVRAAFDTLAFTGTPFAETVIGRPRLGVKTGCNEAFIVVPASANGQEDEGAVTQQHSPSCGRETSLTTITSGTRTGPIESHMLRPLIRGDSARSWAVNRSEEMIIWTHDPGGPPMRSPPPHAKRWLGAWRGDLERRSDSKGDGRWWMLFRTESASPAWPRVVWADIGKSPRAAVLMAGDHAVALNTCYVAQCRDNLDAFALAALLNSPVISAWLGLIAEPARGGYRRFLGWTMSLLPLPADWARARRIMAPVCERAMAGTPPTDAALIAATLDAFQLRESDIAPLMHWSSEAQK